MKIHLDELDHQREALSRVLEQFPPLKIGGHDNVCDTPANYVYANPLIESSRKEGSFIDCKMETGTGKTYVYTRLMYELHQKYGHFKFIIVVPSLAIKEGTKNFITSDYARQHFARFYPNKTIELHVIQSGDFTKKRGRYTMSSCVESFCAETANSKNVISVLLISDKGFLDRADSSLFKDHYDQTLIASSNCPATAIKYTRPIVIIDEPHRLKRDGSSYKNIIAYFAPQSVVRFGATFPLIARGSGRGAVRNVDYYRGQPAYDLNAVESFNQDLVKGVRVHYPNLPEEGAMQYRVKAATSKELTVVCGSRECTIKNGENLSSIDKDFHGDVTYMDKKLSNELEIEVGMILTPALFTNSYQELLLSQALDAHFETEIANFYRKEDGAGYRVKTNALFFIDSIASYRGVKDAEANGAANGEVKAWLRERFEAILKEKIDALLIEHTTGDYHEFLRATLADIGASHGGYFAKDWGEPDESAITEEVNDILHKERTLPFKKPDGSWNTRRFFFSKWTLREGWDNPNVFTICKLRSSGSEISKIQEVGRGLRLPVDEEGNRLSNQTWRLNYLIDYSERDFAQTLIDEINQDAKVYIDADKLTDETIVAILDIEAYRERYVDKMGVLTALVENGMVDGDLNFVDYAAFKSAHPLLFESQLKAGRVEQAGGKQARPPKKLRTENWEKIRDIWEKIARRHSLEFERLAPGEIEELFASVLNTDGIFDENESVSVTIHQTHKDEQTDAISLTEEVVQVANPHLMGALKYNDFVKRLSRRTCIPVACIHRALWRRLGEYGARGEDKASINKKLNHNSLEKIVRVWRFKFEETFAQKHNYSSLSYYASTSCYKNGSFVSEIESGMLGTSVASDIVDDGRNLFEHPAYFDSELEHEVEKQVPPPGITVFGKIPRRAIKVPTYIGTTTTPDFIYAKTIEKNGKPQTELALFVETKPTDTRVAEQRAIDAQKKFFSLFDNASYSLATSADEVAAALRELVGE